MHSWVQHTLRESTLVLKLTQRGNLPCVFRNVHQGGQINKQTRLNYIAQATAGMRSRRKTDPSRRPTAVTEVSREPVISASSQLAVCHLLDRTGYYSRFYICLWIVRPLLQPRCVTVSWGGKQTCQYFLTRHWLRLLTRRKMSSPVQKKKKKIPPPRLWLDTEQPHRELWLASTWPLDRTSLIGSLKRN